MVDGESYRLRAGGERKERGGAGGAAGTDVERSKGICGGRGGGGECVYTVVASV